MGWKHTRRLKKEFYWYLRSFNHVSVLNIVCEILRSVFYTLCVSYHTNYRANPRAMDFTSKQHAKEIE